MDVMLSAAKRLAFLGWCNGEILRLWLRMTAGQDIRARYGAKNLTVGGRCFVTPSCSCPKISFKHKNFCHGIAESFSMKRFVKLLVADFTSALVSMNILAFMQAQANRLIK